MNYFNKLPRYVIIKNEKFIINTDYRIFLKFEEQMQGNDTKKAIYNALSSFYPAFFDICNKKLINEAVEQFIWFYKCGKDKIKQNGKGTAKQVFNYEYDSDLIWASFYMYARVDLTQKLHWWKFKAIWNSLPSDCEFCKIKGYRAYNGTDKQLLELKEIYKLPPTELEIQKEVMADKIFEMLK